MTPRAVLFSALLLGILTGVPQAGFSAGPEDTLLMFVGEPLDVLSIASRREESAARAPAVAQVITRDMMETQAVHTLAQALAQTPGFYMAEREWGSQPYLRGIPDSVLFLYDTVPLLSDMTKSVHPIDEELSLAPVKRIEIIRGPGSVLWGPDAFAGIVNIVPLTGKDLNGVETGVYYGGPGEVRGCHINAGYDAGAWDGFLSLIGREDEPDDRSANLVGFWGHDRETPLPPEERFGHDRADRPQFFELVGNLNLRDWVTLSGRYSDYTRPYSISDKDEDLVWLESRSTPVSYLKLEAKKDLDSASAMRFTGYYSAIRSENEVIDLESTSGERTYYGELIYDRNFMSGKGLLTTGAAWRRKQVVDAPIWGSYLPDYLGEENETFLPEITEEDYRTELWSLFSQYSHKIGKAELLLGVRSDQQNAYRDSLSYNTGVVWSPVREWTAKAFYGSAYRTPFANQLFEDGKPDPEEINTVSLEVAWQPSRRAEIRLCGFVNHIAEHVIADPYAGLSRPNRQKIKGLEIEGRIVPIEGLTLSANLTAMDNSGSDETYHYNDYSFIRPDGSIEKHYTDIFYPYDIGSDTLANLMAKWEPSERITLFCRLSCFSSRLQVCPRCGTEKSISGAWLVDTGLTLRDVVMQGLDLQLLVWNLTDREYSAPGSYSAIDAEPFSAKLLLQMEW